MILEANDGFEVSASRLSEVFAGPTDAIAMCRRIARFGLLNDGIKSVLMRLGTSLPPAPAHRKLKDRVPDWHSEQQFAAMLCTRLFPLEVN